MIKLMIKHETYGAALQAEGVVKRGEERKQWGQLRSDPNPKSSRGACLTVLAK